MHGTERQRTPLFVGLSCSRTSRKALLRYLVCEEPLTCGLGLSSGLRSLAREAVRLVSDADAELFSTLGRSNILSSIPRLFFICFDELWQRHCGRYELVCMLRQDTSA